MKIYGYTVDHGKPHEKIFISKWFHTKLVHPPANLSLLTFITHVDVDLLYLIHEIDTEPSGDSSFTVFGFLFYFSSKT